PSRAIEYRQVKKAGKYFWEVLVEWEDLPSEDATWQSWDAMRELFPNFLLENKEALEGDGNDADTARRLKNAASRAWHARRRLSRRASEVRYADRRARTGDDTRDTIGDGRGFERAGDEVHAHTYLGARGIGNADAGQG
ncbi:Unknown protein, partial [Striga hermonthica]